MSNVKIKTSALSNINNVKDVKRVKNALNTLNTTDNVFNDPNVKKEVKRLLVKHGLTLDTIVKKYKEIVDTSPKDVKASDILNALKRLESLHGVDVREREQPVSNVVIALQSKSDNEIKTFIANITNKTQEYLERLERPTRTTRVINEDDPERV